MFSPSSWAVRVSEFSLSLLIFFVLSSDSNFSEATWCVCAGTNTTALQAALDYACDKGADCAAINPNGLCFQSTDLLSRCSYAVNSYFQKNNQASEACNFAGTANITSNDPSTYLSLSTSASLMGKLNGVVILQVFQDVGSPQTGIFGLQDSSFSFYYYSALVQCCDSVADGYAGCTDCTDCLRTGWRRYPRRFARVRPHVPAGGRVDRRIRSPGFGSRLTPLRFRPAQPGIMKADASFLQTCVYYKEIALFKKGFRPRLRLSV